MNSKQNIAIIGIGHWGKNLLKECAVQANVIWCAHKGHEETKKFLAESYPTIQTTTSYEDILNDPSVEAVIVATPTPTHFDIAQKVLQANKHLFLEKPGCTQSTELERLYTLASEKNLVFFVGYEFSHHSAWKKIRELIPKHTIQSIHMEWFKWGTFKESSISNLLCHDISLLYNYTQHITPTNLLLTKVISDSDILTATFDCDSFKATSYINRVSTEKRKTVTIISDTLTLIWNNDELFSFTGKEKKLIPLETNTRSAVYLEIEHFIQLISMQDRRIENDKIPLEIFKLLEKVTSLRQC